MKDEAREFSAQSADSMRAAWNKMFLSREAGSAERDSQSMLSVQMRERTNTMGKRLTRNTVTASEVKTRYSLIMTDKRRR